MFNSKEPCGSRASAKVPRVDQASVLIERSASYVAGHVDRSVANSGRPCSCRLAGLTWLRTGWSSSASMSSARFRRIVLHLPRATPDLEAWQRIAVELGVRTG